VGAARRGAGGADGVLHSLARHWLAAEGAHRAPAVHQLVELGGTAHHLLRRPLRQAERHARQHAVVVRMRAGCVSSAAVDRLVVAGCGGAGSGGRADGSATALEHQMQHGGTQ